eukprot:TRINITY_DN63659_c0_g1_i1.p2 TRINITY_DN63659_c0_g1~~TRINITY_DN63659_c0_g1_i1.p2  ORF type:complete len:203 (+),score=38.84 TRINITY_DN63659_c0_g1_i1:17-625(+)
MMPARRPVLRSCPKHWKRCCALVAALLVWTAEDCRSLKTYVRPVRLVRVALSAEADAVSGPPVKSESWQASVDAVVQGIQGSTAEDANEWLQAGFAWTQKSKRFWRKSRVEEQPDPGSVCATVAWLAERGLAESAWVKRFPEVLGLSVKELEESQETAPSYLKKPEAFLKAARANPQLLGNNYDCLAEHDSCQGQCSRCWNT